MSLKRKGYEEGGVDPSKGQFVEMEGVMEVRWMSGHDEILERQDFYEFQGQVSGAIPADFCHKNYDTGEQVIFFCLVCDCELKSVIPLKAHVEGNKHIRKSLAFKQRTLGYEPEPVNQPKKKKIIAPKQKIDCSLPLKDRLLDFEGPILGLNYITEFTDPTDYRAVPLYTCKMEGCKSAWGNSDDMFNHIKKDKHIRNYFNMKYPDDTRVNSLNKNELMKFALEHTLKENIFSPAQRPYDTMIQVPDLERYKEIENRPRDWSEKRQKLTGRGSNSTPFAPSSSSSNANLTPIGYKDRGIFNEEKWKDVKTTVTVDESVQERKEIIDGKVKKIRDMINDKVAEDKILLLIEIALDSIQLNVDFFQDDERCAEMLNREKDVKTEILRLKDKVVNKPKPLTQSQQKQMDREKFTQLFKQQIQELGRDVCEGILKGKPTSLVQEIWQEINAKIDKQIMPQEIKSFAKKEKSWTEFKVKEGIKIRVTTYITECVQRILEK
eukprot:TRINITY_DN3430_c0_g1_i13.p1 TRINITY_DN3430_c0_g1~~TRINITY_DN3430_c0_g1_i13.p1  ORF type:complete len:495 (-),score=132.26 TRINITY_DN3430_c0_g1_i13:183-1667(-)